MLILSVDTSGRQGSIALANAAADSLTVREIVPLAGRSYSALLIPELAALLARHSVGKHQVDAFAVVAGPGSFTGLRVGLAAVKALAEVGDRAIAAVSMLEAIAAQAGHDGRVTAALDAGRREVYVGEYEFRREGPVLLRELLMNYEQFATLLNGTPGAELITPDPSVAAIATAHLYVRQIDWPDAGKIARLGFDKIRAGRTVTPDVLEANYIRRSDAEIFSAPPKDR
jgi:tRNA threonylcarbamoyladenosine biosynthesis protein TsaB